MSDDFEWIRERLAYIESVKDNDEAAHDAEDHLMVKFITYVAENGPEPLNEMAREVLKSQEILFERTNPAVSLELPL